MKIIGWNINGLRGKSMNLFSNKEFNLNSDLNRMLEKYNPDVVCFGETKCQDIHLDLLNMLPFKYKTSICSQARKGYSGVSILSNLEFKDLGSIKLKDNDIEGRSRVIEFDKYILIYVYTPNSGGRYDYRVYWDKIIYDYLKNININNKMIIYCGDLNVVHEYDDIYNESILNKGEMPGTLIEERNRFNNLLNLGYIDIWRYMNPNKKQYTWWNPRTRSRLTNNGWRIDYFLIKKKEKKNVKDCKICDEIEGSDHCPILLEVFD
tara:strand:- start:547 stop:1338 length:792 start_codon:yes stop_codon:yes gene_type:complete